MGRKKSVGIPFDRTHPKVSAQEVYDGKWSPLRYPWHGQSPYGITERDLLRWYFRLQTWEWTYVALQKESWVVDRVLEIFQAVSGFSHLVPDFSIMGSVPATRRTSLPEAHCFVDLMRFPPYSLNPDLAAMSSREGIFLIDSALYGYT